MYQILKKIVINLPISVLLIGFFVLHVEASNYPTIYGGKTTVTQTQDGITTTVYSQEIVADEKDETGSRTKVFAEASDTPFPERFTPDPSIGDCSSTPFECLLVNNSLLANPVYYLWGNAHPNIKLFSGKVTSDGKDLDTESVLVYPSNQIVGDVYTAKSNLFDNYTFFGQHLHEGKAPASNAAWKIAGYSIDPSAITYWNGSSAIKNSEMGSNIRRLINLAEDFNPLSTSLVSPVAVNSPEGKVYYVNGNWEIRNNFSFSGVATVIVAGDFNITGAGKLINSGQLGIIALGDVNITGGSGVDNLKLAIFTPRTVKITRSLDFLGSIVANNIDITSKSARIKYNVELTKIPPPGFNYLFLPQSQADY